MRERDRLGQRARHRSPKPEDYGSRHRPSASGVVGRVLSVRLGVRVRRTELLLGRRGHSGHGRLEHRDRRDGSRSAIRRAGVGHRRREGPRGYPCPRARSALGAQDPPLGAARRRLGRGGCCCSSTAATSSSRVRSPLVASSTFRRPLPGRRSAGTPSFGARISCSEGSSSAPRLGTTSGFCGQGKLRRNCCGCSAIDGLWFAASSRISRFSACKRVLPTLAPPIRCKVVGEVSGG